MVCPKCGKFSENAKFCPGCGEKLVPPPDATQFVPESNTGYQTIFSVNPAESTGAPSGHVDAPAAYPPPVQEAPYGGNPSGNPIPPVTPSPQYPDLSGSGEKPKKGAAKKVIIAVCAVVLALVIAALIILQPWKAMAQNKIFYSKNNSIVSGSEKLTPLSAILASAEELLFNSKGFTVSGTEDDYDIGSFSVRFADELSNVAFYASPEEGDDVQIAMYDGQLVVYDVDYEAQLIDAVQLIKDVGEYQSKASEMADEIANDKEAANAFSSSYDDIYQDLLALFTEKGINRNALSDIVDRFAGTAFAVLVSQTGYTVEFDNKRLEKFDDVENEWNRNIPELRTVMQVLAKFLSEGVTEDACRTSSTEKHGFTTDYTLKLNLYFLLDDWINFTENDDTASTVTKFLFGGTEELEKILDQMDEDDEDLEFTVRATIEKNYLKELEISTEYDEYRIRITDVNDVDAINTRCADVFDEIDTLEEDDINNYASLNELMRELF